VREECQSEVAGFEAGVDVSALAVVSLLPDFESEVDELLADDSLPDLPF
jgi:hypothetical protein